MVWQPILYGNRFEHFVDYMQIEEFFKYEGILLSYKLSKQLSFEAKQKNVFKNWVAMEQAKTYMNEPNAIIKHKPS